jgi:hypothetical protein
MREILDSISIDRSKLTVAPLGTESNDAYWASKTPQERIEAMEWLRIMNYGYDPTTERLQRVLTVFELGES